MRRSLAMRSASLLLALALSGCAARAPAAPPPESASTGEAAPSLVVLVVFDQLAAWVLDAHLPHLPEDGILRRARAEGAYAVGDYPYAATETAPGHATLGTGVSPAVHGIVANAYLEEGRVRGSADDGRSEVIGAPGRHAGPGRLQAPTVGDLLVRATDDRAEVVTLSFKDRAAVFTAGREADLAVFYDTARGVFTTSTAYAPDGVLPAWLARYGAEHPTSERLGPWLPADPEGYAERYGVDDYFAEASCFGGAPAFPYDSRTAPDPYEAHKCTPMATEQLFDLALVAVDAMHLGQDEVPDLLVVSVSGTDYVGHAYGPQSWEYADHLARADRALARFAEALAARGPVTFLLTADHGVLPLPERIQAEDVSAGRIPWRELEEAVASVPGGAEALEGVLPPLVYLGPEADGDPTLRAAIGRAVASAPHVAGAYDVREGESLRRSQDPLERRVGESLPAGVPGDLFLVPEYAHFFELPGLGEHGTHHGTPYDYDRQVPILIWGVGVTRRESEEPVDQRRVATTLAHLLGIDPPPGAPREPLPGVRSR